MFSGHYLKRISPCPGVVRGCRLYFKAPSLMITWTPGRCSHNSRRRRSWPPERTGPRSWSVGGLAQRRSSRGGSRLKSIWISNSMGFVRNSRYRLESKIFLLPRISRYSLTLAPWFWIKAISQLSILDRKRIYNIVSSPLPEWAERAL